MRPLRSERGSISLELAICAPLLLGILALVGIFGRTATATSNVDGAAFSAARSASIERSAGGAQAAAAEAARSYLDQQGLTCDDVTVDVNTSGFGAPAGTSSQVTVTVGCRVPLADLAALVTTEIAPTPPRPPARSTDTGGDDRCTHGKHD